MEQYQFWVATTVIGLMIGALGFFLKRTLTEVERKIERSERSNKERFEALEKRVEKQDERFDQLVQGLPTKYAYRDDLIRMSQNIEGKLDRIQDLLMGLGIKGGGNNGT